MTVTAVDRERDVDRRRCFGVARRHSDAVSNGQRRVSHGLYRSTGFPASSTELYAALLSVLPPGSVIAGLSAALVHGMWLPHVEWPKIPDVIAPSGVKAPRDRPHSERSEIRLRRRRLREDEKCCVDGLPVTSVVRTWIDLAESLPIIDLVAAGDWVLRSGVPFSALMDAVRAATHRRGVVAARMALDLLDGRSASRPESHLRCALVMGGLPAPEVNVPIHDEVGGWLAEPDLLYREARLALEYNGTEHASQKRMRKDITRSLDLQRAGWRVVVFGPAEVFGRPESTAALVRAHLDVHDPTWRRRVA